MIHFPSSLHSSNALPNRSDSLKLNATQQKAPTHKIFLTIEEELHDARRVHSHGQEEDLRLALNMLIERLSQVSTMLSDAYKTNADLEVQLNVIKSNLALITANNEMLEDALKQRDGTAQNLGWRRTSARAYSTDDVPQASGGDRTPTSAVEFPAAQENSRFFKFRFTQGSSSGSGSGSTSSTSRPGTPGASPAMSAASLNSSSMPALGTIGVKEREREMQLEKELEKERKACEDARKAKQALEAELESLSQALFEEANKMVATERIRLADIEEELREAKLEKEALRSALRLLEGHASSSASPALPSTTASASTSPNLTLSSTSTTTASSPPSISVSASPPSQPLPPSLSTTITTDRITARPPSISSSTTIRPSLPPPAPLEVPTTPFDYSAAYADTPTPRPLEDPLPGSDGDGDGETSAEVEPGPWGRDRDLEREAGERVSAREALEPNASVRGEEEHVPVDAGENENENRVKYEEKGMASLPQAQDEEKRRPLGLDLSRAQPLSLEHEPDPWADAPSVLGSATRSERDGVGSG
ncbi:hypothetical protein C0995_012019 [Termitomyces sp. Mi166|nr:hypothetical protein C0995_012019 [Termitomyces sp. Mi166\